MNRHQILSGACNAGDRCYAVGSVEGIPFTAYAAGCNIVILASSFERVQIIPGAVHGYVKISALDCSVDTGKIAAAYEDKICIFEPTPLIQLNSISSHNLDYRWVQTGYFCTNAHITSLSWNLEGTRLLTGGANIQMWREKLTGNVDKEPSVTFEIGGDRDVKTPTNEKDEDKIAWECIWSCQTAIPVYHMAFSPDGTLFATAGKCDRLVKVWYENKHVLFPTKSFDGSQYRSETFDSGDLNFSFVYIAHPRAVTHLSWRKTSKYMPKGSVSNMLVTSCLDNICRIWIETVLPDDGLVNMVQFDPLASQNPKFRTHRHKHRFMQRLKHMKTCFHIRRHAKNGTIFNTMGGNGNNHGGLKDAYGNSPIPSLPSTYSVHDFHSYGYHGTGVSPGMHFHLAASINAETDIPLVPSILSSDANNQPNFILHWLNNKEMHFSLQAEAILQELTQKLIDKEDGLKYGSGSHQSDEYPPPPSEENRPGGVEELMTKKYGKINKSFSHEESNGDENSSKHSMYQAQHSGVHHINSVSNTTSLNSLPQDNVPPPLHIVDSLDMKIDCLLRDWHHSPDLLFSVHPIDGSYLIWVIEWLDDYYPGSFRQAQVSFSTRIPGAFPLGDAMSMSTTVSLYNTGSHPLYFREMVKGASSKKTKPSTVNVENETNEQDQQSCLPSVLEEEDDQDKKDGDQTKDNSAGDGTKAETDTQSADKQQQNEISFTQPSPTVSMVTKHSNGTLNLWQLSFADKTKFTQVLSIGHVCRASGHRFRVNDITCHPVLPLLLTTSHHNISDAAPTPDTEKVIRHQIKDVFTTSGFCSELILWRVDAVGPLSHSGGVSELARINSPEISAFSNVAWIPTLLPSTTLGSFSNSPSACFVASDGESLRVYQAVIDARTLLAEISSSERVSKKRSSSMSSLSSQCSSDNPIKSSLHDKIKIVSQQSTARPGCIIRLDAIADATHDWQNTQFLHVFQEQLITGERNDNSIDEQNEHVTEGLMETQLSAMVDLQRNAEFKEPFYIVIIERTTNGSTIHMWRIVIASKPQTPYLSESAMYVPDSNIVQDIEETESSHGGMNHRQSIFDGGFGDNVNVEIEAPHISIETEKVCTQELPLPDGVDVVHASPAAGHLSSSSIYPACFAPYIIVTACSDSTSRFWRCNVRNLTNESGEKKLTYEWCEWKMLSKLQDSAIEISGQPLNISAAYSGRIACAYKYGKSFTRPNKGDPDSRYINLCVAIYECESTGGSEWVLEDTIHLRNIHLPRIQVDPNLDLSYLHDNSYLQKKQRINHFLQTFTHEEVRSPRSGDITPELCPKPAGGLLAVPSFSTLQSLRKSITENGNTCPLTQKHLVQLDWVSKEDGSHILTVAVGSKILLYTPVCSDLAQANMKAMKESHSVNRPLLRKASSLAQPHFNDEIRWMKLRQIDLQTADGLPPLPMQISWVRDGILVVGMDSEMHVYSQWKPRVTQSHSVEDILDSRNLRDEDLRSLVQDSSQRHLANVSSMPHLSKVSSVNLQILSLDKKKKASQSTSHLSSGGQDTIQIHDYMTDYGLFQASRIACPVLPQYHPKQLMELLNSGKIRWVKAILAHLVRCMSGGNMSGVEVDSDNMDRQKGWSRSRTLSMSYVGGVNSPSEPKGSTTQIPEELTLDYTEIISIPPLPLWVLLSADKETTAPTKKQKEEMVGYDALFDGGIQEEDSLDDLLDNENESTKRFDRRQSIPERQNISHFGPRQGQLLSRLLTHTHLPGLSSLDQMHLLALADTVATCNTDFAEKFVTDAAKTAISKENLTGSGGIDNVSTDSLDDCGLRFLLAMKHFAYLLRCLPLTQRNQLQKQGVGTSNIVWAFHSESEEELLNLIPSYSKGHLKWATLRELGVGLWLRNISLLKQCIEKLAKAAYQQNQNPLDAAIYYLAMKKKSLVWGLFRSQRDEKMTAFFSNNFNDNRWRKAALKNAFVLLGKQRFDHAVAFFLLANSLNDAIEVCLNKLEDFQLALVIARLYEAEHDTTPPMYRKLLYEHILGSDADGNNQDLSKAHPDPFLRSIALWILKDYSGSLNTLLLNSVGHNHNAYREEDLLFKNENSQSMNPNVFNFYIYLRTHPLIIRQHIASTAQEKKRTQVVLSGFSYSGEVMGVLTSDKQLQIEDAITPLERQLYFTTAHGHFKAGCPALALEVLSKLPSKVLDSAPASEIISPSETDKDKLITTGMMDWGLFDGGSKTNDTVDTNVTSSAFASSQDLDWGAPASKLDMDEGFKIVWDEEEEKHSDDEELEKNDTQSNGPITMNADKKEDRYDTTLGQRERLDIMAQQLKFIACLKILMEELSTLATGFEVDGGQLRYQLYIWLEREVDALKQLCNYCSSECETAEDTKNAEYNQFDKDSALTQKVSDKPTLHEILLQEKQDFEAKVQRAARRKRWLKANETLLRTLLSYCSLHGASGGGLASVRMELVLLLQELQQEKTQQQLLSPLPFPTTLPLLSACVAGNKTVIADPIRYLQSHTQDMLQTVVEFRQPPVVIKERLLSDIYILRDLAIALSSCIYQSLCDSETFIVSHAFERNGYQSPGIENIAKLNASYQSSHLMVNVNIHQRKRKYSTDEPVFICTPPSKWPGVTNLRALLAREKDEDIPKLNVLLLEAFIATYMALLVYGLSTCDCHILYRLIGQNFTTDTWAKLFGGGIKKLLRTAATANQQGIPAITSSQDMDIPSPSSVTAPGESSVWTAVTSLTKQRVKLNMKLLGQFNSPTGVPTMKEDKPTYREQFVPPEMSMVTYFLMKPTLIGDMNEEDYDTDDSVVSEEEEDEEVFSDFKEPIGTVKDKKDNQEHSNPLSLSWIIMRLAIIKLAQKKLQDFINIAGVELQELPVTSPFSHAVLRVLSEWQDILNDDLLSRGSVPSDFIPGCYVETDVKGPAIHKYRSLLEKHNTPFISRSVTAPARRLWNYLVRQEHVQDIFVRAVFGKRRTTADTENESLTRVNSDLNSIVDTGSPGSGGEHVNHQSNNFPEPIRIIHKEQESISAFCINNVSPGLISLATPKEIQEMDITLLLESPSWYEDECEYDILNLSKDPDSLPTSSFLVIQTPTDKNVLNQNMMNIQNYNNATPPQVGTGGQSGRGTSVVLKHKVDNIKRMNSHPLMPLYLTGGQDGSVQLWEWGHQQVVCTPRPPGTFAKVTRCRFSQHGNKFGIADGDGNLSLWQAGLSSQSNRSFFTYQCHSKNIADFVFLGSCSLVATAGHSSENRNVGIWDTLLPQKKSLVSSFTCHDQGASSLVYAPQHQVLISAGKKGDICVFDVRQRTLRQRFQAHESSVKCIALDPHEEIFVTGSAEGDIKLWSLSSHTQLQHFAGEHARSSFFKHIGQGVSQLQLDSHGRLFSCGSDGSMKVRQLPNREMIVQSLY